MSCHVLWCLFDPERRHSGKWIRLMDVCRSTLAGCKKAWASGRCNLSETSQPHSAIRSAVDDLIAWRFKGKRDPSRRENSTGAECNTPSTTWSEWITVTISAMQMLLLCTKHTQMHSGNVFNKVRLGSSHEPLVYNHPPSDEWTRCWFQYGGVEPSVEINYWTLREWTQ